MTSTANTATTFSTADPLTRQPLGERPVYATGMLLDAQDFLDEQTYHRSQLARALGAVAGSGTLAGLRVEHRPAVDAGPGARPEEIQVNAGLAVDRLGRLIELPRPACLRVQRWWDAEAARSNLLQADYTTPGRFMSARAQAGVTLPTRAVVADVFLRFVACPRGLTPAFASGPFDALNAVSVSRLRDAYELHLVPRHNLTDAGLGLPLRPGAFTLPVEEETAAEALAREAAMDDPSADPAVRRAALQDAVLHGYHRTADELPRGPEHPPTVDASAVFIARLLIPVEATDPSVRQGSAVLIDNHSRRFLPGLGVLARWTGL
ncbi:hypothetical protein [Hydrogenophaga sp. PBL-H3]|uniref:hypothetical protein n=1 Tax=Hydrogenophaga sp. PBL-H3 TaxID=434010 RepID=UPI00131F4D88|nr:hypothetical protein [Hydrogenophaga sp. PBL-H3]QHE75793.1 hypothetical protein F9Z45_06835 [Hydrogenophaga sp. PBL-H3]QHE80218.1 hypothetical protein F9Z44_06835 [Hydrogenophaga sp. PBL-H3]